MNSIRRINSPIFGPEEQSQLVGCAVLDPDTWDATIIGLVRNGAGEAVLAYSYTALVELLANEFGQNDGVGSEEAAEMADDWLNFNTLRALDYMGPRAPVVLVLRDPEMEHEEEVCDVTVYELGGREWVSVR